MSPLCGRALSEQIEVFKIFNKKSKTDKKCFSGKRFTAHSKYSKHYSKADEENKMKRLKTRKERSQIKGGWKEISKIKSHQHHCHCQSNVDMAHLHNCCHASCHCSSKRNPPFPSVVPSAQEPSIITDSRLIGHHGLFNHEVKSVDIERLLSEQQKLEENEQTKEKSTAISHLSSTSHNSAPLSSGSLLGADTDVMSFKKKADPSSKDHIDCREKEKKSLQFDMQLSDVTPGQRPLQQLALSSESFQSSHSSKRSFFNVVTTKTKKACTMSENSRESLLTPIVNRHNLKTLNADVKHVISTLEQTPENQGTPVQRIQSHGLSTSPLKLSSSPTTDSCDIQDRRQNPEYVTKSVSAVAARLCDHLKLPLMRRRNLLSESREVLLNSLQERHGPWLQENLLRVQQHLSFAVHPRNKVQDHDQEPTRINEEELFPADMPVKMPGSRHFNWKPSPQPHCSQKQAADWLRSPMDTSVSILDNILRPSLSPQLYIDFEPCGASESNLFTFSAALCQREKASGLEDWEDSFNRSKSKKSLKFDSFENSFMDHTRAIGKRSPGYSDINTQPSFSYQAQLPDRHAGEPMHFARQEDLFGTGRYSCALSFPAQIHHESNHFQPLRQFSHSSACPPLKSQNTDMMYYPPSYMLERDPTPSLSAFPSPEHWSFPPMRLY